MLTRVLLLVSGMVGVAWLGGVSAQLRCPDGFWTDQDDGECIGTSMDITMTLPEADQYCELLQGRLFQPKGSNINTLKRYADQVFLPDPDLWGRYWVGLTQDLTNAWKRNLVERGPGGPYCVALDYRRPVNAQHASFYGYDNRDCRSEIRLPAICVVDAVAEVRPEPPENLASPTAAACPEPEPCPDCPPAEECPVVECPPLQPCEKATASLEPVPPPTCPETWFTRRGFCYHFLIRSATWKDALDSCRRDGAELVSIDDREENDFLIAVSNDLSEATPSMRRYWIGLSDQLKEGVMVWTDGERAGFTSWGPRQPSVHKKRRFEENCVVINSQNVGLWDDIACWRRHPYICKKPATSPR